MKNRNENSIHLIEEPDTENDDNLPLLSLNSAQILSGLKILMNAVLPNIAGIVSTALVGITFMHFIGHLNRPVLLAAIGLGQTWANAFGIVILISLNGGFVTLAAQAFGAGKHRLLGIFYQKCLVIYAILVIPLGIFLFFSDSLMIALGIEEEVARLAGKFLRCSLPAFLAQAFYDCTKNLLVAQNIFYYQASIQIFTCILNIFWCQIFVVYFDLDLVGVALSKVITEFLNAVLLIVVIKKFDLSKEAWIPWSPEALEDVFNFFKEISTIGSSIYLEWIAFESTIIIVGLLKDNVILAAHASVFNYTFFYYTFPVGLSIAMTTYVGNSVGEGKQYKAQKFALLGAIISFFIAFVGTLFGTVFCKEIALFFTPEPAVSAVLSNLVFYYAICTFGDTFIAVLPNILKPLNKQDIVMKYFIFTYYGIGIPTSYFLGIVFGFGIDGVWIGMGLEIHLMVCLMLWQLWLLDWKKEIKEIRKGLEKHKDHLHETENRLELNVLDSIKKKLII